MSNLILIVEDEPKLAQSISEYMLGSGYKTHIINDGREVADWLNDHQPALVLLDTMLPGKDGIEICRDIRSNSHVPIIMVTAKTDEIDRLLGLEMGADDYVCKPFSLRELSARVKAVLRRHEYIPKHEESGLSLSLSRASSRAKVGEKSIELTAIEFNMLERLSKAPGKIFRREDLMDVAYEDGRIVNDRTVDSHMTKIRKKLSMLDADKKFIHSIYGIGYKLEL